MQKTRLGEGRGYETVLTTPCLKEEKGMKKYPELTHNYLSDRIIQIGDSVGNACTLILGDTRAILFDTMTGACDLKSYVRTLTDLPVAVVLSHGHFDHSFGSWQFGEVFMSEPEIGVMEESRELLSEIVENTGVKLPEEIADGDFACEVHTVEEGETFELGGISAVVKALPGHTKGSIGLLVPEERILLVGDAVSPQMCLFFPVSLPLDVYRETLRKVKGMPIDRFVGSHFMQAFPISMIETFEACTEAPGKKRGMKYAFAPVPEYHGLLYIHEMRNPVIDDVVCIIMPDA